MIHALAALVLATACATRPPSPAEQADICDVFDDRKDWFRDAARSEKDWGVPIGLMMAFIKHESGFDDSARPPRGERRFFGLLKGRRLSSAYGYAQALDGTWDDYRRATGNRSADRDSFDDAIDFVGWYVDRSARQAGIRRTDARNQYLAYHEGPAGYLSGGWRSKPKLLETAEAVAAQAYIYDQQLAGCRDRLSRRGLFGF